MTQLPSFANHDMKSLLAYYNEAATELGRATVNRFSDRQAAESRCTAICEALRVHRAATPEAVPVATTKAAPTNATPAQADVPPAKADAKAQQPRKESMTGKTTVEDFKSPKEGSRYARILDLLLENRNKFIKVADGAKTVYPGKEDMTGAFMMGFTGLQKKAEKEGLKCELRKLKEGKEVSVGLFEEGK